MNQSEKDALTEVVQKLALKGNNRLEIARELYGDPTRTREYESHASRAEAYADAAEILLDALNKLC